MRIVILSEAPGADEDLQGRPLVGRAGIFFSKCLENAGIRRDRVWVTNVLLCRPPDNDITTEAAKHAIGCCEHGLREELEAAWKAGYRVIVAQGNTALHALGFEGMKITSYRGSILEGDTLRENGFPPFRVIPTLHPAALIRSSWKGRDGGTADPTMTYISDLEKARKVADPAWKPTEENFLIEPSYTEAYATLERWIKNRTTLAIDIETDGLNGNYAKPVCIGFAEDESHAMCLPIRNKGRNDLYWPEFEWGHLRSMVEEILLGNKLILQNAMFDIPFLKFSGEYKVDPHNVLYDTAVVHSLVAPEALHNLGYITSMFGTTSYWKDSFKNREGSIYSLDQRTLWTYNSRDCVVLWQVIRPMLELVKKNHLEEELALEQKLLPVLISMKINGIGFEGERLGEFKKKFEGLLEDSEKELRAIGSLPSHFNLSSKAHMRLFLYGYKSPSLAKAEKEVEKRENDIIDFERKKASLLEGTDGMKLTPARREKLLAQMEARILRTKSTKVLADAMAEAEVAKYTICPIQLSSYKPLLSDSGELSTADDAITSFRHALQKREFELERRVEDHEVARASLDGESKASARRVYLSQKAEAEAVQIGTMLNFIDAYSDWVEQQKLYSSFTKYKPALDGRIHPNYNAFGTATGRLSCIAQGELVSTFRGQIPIERVKKGDLVWTHQGRWRKVEALLSQGIKHCIRLTTESGHHIICTDDHKILSENHTWVTAKEATCVCLENSLERSGPDSKRPECLPRESREALYIGNRQTTLYDRAQCNSDTQITRFSRTSQGRTISAILTLEKGRKKSDARKDGRETSQLEGSMLRQEGASYSQGEWKARVRASFDFCKGSGIKILASLFHRTSHRWKRGKQLSGQPCSMHASRAQTTSQKVERITGKSPVGEVPVYDLVVSADHSFCVGGIIVHNCSEPNIQQLPKKGIGKDIRKFFIASPGHKFISADYTNAEIGIMGCETQDPLILGAYFGGRNIHDDNTQTLFGVNKDNPMWSAARGAAKIFQFGRYQYGGSLGQIYKQVLLKCPDLNVTLKELEAADARWWEAHPAVTEWGKQIEAEVMEKRIIRNEAGRIRIFLGNNHDIVKEAKNFKIQSFVAYLANRALVDVDEELRARKLAAIPVLQVHDQLILEAPDEEVEEVCALLSSCMTKPFMYKGKEYSLRADPSVGDSYGDLD